MPHSRARLAPEEMRRIAVEAASAILIEDGPQAVTLVAVSARIGRTHANLLHHFGSAEGLRAAMAEMMTRRIKDEIGATVLRLRAVEGDVGEVVELTFDIFEKQGFAALVSWMILSRDHAGLKPILDAVHDLVEQLGDHRGAPVREITLSLFLCALGDGLMGAPVTQALGLPREAARMATADQLRRMRGW